METNDSLRSCPPCQSPGRCLRLDGLCSMVVDKVQAAMYGAGVEGLRFMRTASDEEWEAFQRALDGPAPDGDC